MTRQAINDFARSLGIAEVNPGEQDLAVFAFDRFGELHLECLEGDMLVTLVRAVEPGSGAAEALFRSCQILDNDRFVVNPAWTRDQRAALSVRLSGDDLETDTIDEVLDYLGNVFDQAAIQ